MIDKEKRAEAQYAIINSVDCEEEVLSSFESDPNEGCKKSQKVHKYISTKRSKYSKGIS